MVANEKNADVRIVDPSRSIQSHRTGDFYSHQWITDCIRQKRRIDETPYLISTVATRHASRPQEERSQHQTSERSGGLVYAPARPLAPSQKRSRNAFTYEDDRILIDWVTREAEKAVKGEEKFLDRGNDMYKKLEEKVVLRLLPCVLCSVSCFTFSSCFYSKMLTDVFFGSTLITPSTHGETGG